MRDEAQAAGTNFSPWIAQVPHAAHRSRSVYHSKEALTNVSPWVAQLQTMVQHERNRKTALEEEKRILATELDTLHHEIGASEREIEGGASTRSYTSDSPQRPFDAQPAGIRPTVVWG